MIRVALRGLAGRKLRTVLTAIAIVLGVAMMSGAYVLTDTIDKAFDAIFVESYAGTDAVVTGKDAGFSFEGESGAAAADPGGRPRAASADVDGVEVAAGSVQDFQTKLLQAGRRGDRHGRRAVVRVRHRDRARVRPLQPAQPRRGPLAVAAAARSRSTRASPTTRTSSSATGSASRRSARRRSSRSSASRKYGELSSLGGATFAIFDVPTAQALLDKEGQLDAVQAAAEDGVTPEQLDAADPRPSSATT